MDETTTPRLDGNACAGLLRELFAYDLTAARGSCASCGAVAQIGGQPLYDYPDGPGAVLRCGSCESVLLVVVRGAGRYRMSATGLRWLEIEAVTE